MKATQRIFRSPWIKLDYLCRKVRYWLYERQSQASAQRYLRRLAQTLKALPQNNEAILRLECLALLAEIKGDIDSAVQYREREIQLMEQLHRDAETGEYSDETRAYMLADRGGDALMERRTILQGLRHRLCQPPR